MTTITARRRPLRRVRGDRRQARRHRRSPRRPRDGALRPGRGPHHRHRQGARRRIRRDVRGPRPTRAEGHRGRLGDLEASLARGRAPTGARAGRCGGTARIADRAAQAAAQMAARGRCPRSRGRCGHRRRDRRPGRYRRDSRYRCMPASLFRLAPGSGRVVLTTHDRQLGCPCRPNLLAVDGTLWERIGALGQTLAIRSLKTGTASSVPSLFRAARPDSRSDMGPSGSWSRRPELQACGGRHCRAARRAERSRDREGFAPGRPRQRDDKAAGNGAVWVLDQDGVLWRLDPATGHVTGHYETNALETSVLVPAAGYEWIGERLNHELLRYDPRTHQAKTFHIAEQAWRLIGAPEPESAQHLAPRRARRHDHEHRPADGRAGSADRPHRNAKPGGRTRQHLGRGQRQPRRPDLPRNGRAQDDHAPEKGRTRPGSRSRIR